MENLALSIALLVAGIVIGAVYSIKQRNPWLSWADAARLAVSVMIDLFR